MKQVVFITGATGFIGTYIIKELIRTTDFEVTALVRASNSELAQARLYREWWEHRDLCAALDNKRIHIVCGDITSHNLGLSDNAYKNLSSSVSYIIHAAADIRLTAPLPELYKTNVQGTVHMLELAHAIHKRKRLKRFSYVSTAYVAGSRQGIILEDTLITPRTFLSNYERSKFQAEQMVLRHKPTLPVSVFRPGMVVGDSKTGYIKTFNTIYILLRTYFKKSIPLIPLRAGFRINLIPADCVAEALVSLTLHAKAVSHTFHLTAPHKALPTSQEFIEQIRSWAALHCNLKLPKARFIGLPLPMLRFFLTLLDVLCLKRNRVIRNLKLLAPYYYENRIFDRSNADRLLKQPAPAWQDFTSPLLQFAVNRGFLNRSARTVQEQLVYRLSKKHLPMRYHEIKDKRIFSMPNNKLIHDVTRAVSALKALGMNKGDCAGIAGRNSIKYLILDTALGLIGAVSVPVFVNISPYELRRTLHQTRLKIFFTGIDDHLRLAEEFKDSTLFISMTNCEYQFEIPSSGVRCWDTFIAGGARTKKSITRQMCSSRLSFDDAATMRFTSGTTGEQKPVWFTHGQLRQMAETLNSLFPWKLRSQPVRYLSFLPMNHVVEGILGMYTPYFAPAKVDIYFLYNFEELVPALKRIKPTIFFSVPRFYEKVYETLSSKGIYKSFVHTRNKIMRKFLRLLLRKAVLRRTGLKHCLQLISGSAPLATSLARRFRELGIEIHDAYGLSEAPLISINRYAHNSLGTVGTPLPETEITIAPDGEILVRGPQVSPACLLNNQPDQDFLHTGDVGVLNSKGELVLYGRKKEIIVTSYGKNIHPLTIENMLKAISNIKEALVVGERKPYISALLWTDAKNAPHSSQLYTSIIKLNSRLSHPERIKRFVLLDYDLSVDNGDFSHGYKLVRQAITRRFEQIIDSLYQGTHIPFKNLIYRGEIAKTS
ncbi:MAG: SDR family oxidoreductase [Spirochaetales bacterium]|nr:SDR family oxidoreductase [Spirochaetales bacterium]